MVVDLDNELRRYFDVHVSYEERRDIFKVTLRVGPLDYHNAFQWNKTVSPDEFISNVVKRHIVEFLLFASVQPRDLILEKAKLLGWEPA